MGARGLAVAFLLGLAGAALASNNGTRICQPAPDWQVDGGVSPMEEALGNVTAARIGSLQERLARAGTAGVRFLIVNHKSAAAQALQGELELRAPRGVPVYSQRGPRPDIWGLLGGAKDDFLVYDRCGRLTFHIQLPFSALSFPFVEAAVRFSHQQDHCGNCSFYPAQVNGTDQAESAAQSPGQEGRQGPLSEGPNPHRPTLLSGSPPPAQTHGPDHSPGEQPPPSPPPHSLEQFPHMQALI
ncbi:selenoprotein Pb-like [Sarcophilus harrisii]|uniref:selenoprotein Pb-like n=1 Tax=Sarcophilus harrisii TaxID=9305 RepID=UPI001301C5F9|nr:selenoprotein Pb-like [Sarcophilus harrisii]